MSEEHETTSEDLLREFEENPPSNIEESNQRFERLGATMSREYDETEKEMLKLKQEALARIEDLECRLKQLRSDKEKIQKEGAKAISIAEERLIIDRAKADQGIKTIRSLITANPKLEEDREELLLICDKLSNGIYNPGVDLEELGELSKELMKRVGLEEFMTF